jgi:hypothetical protein
LNGLAFGKIVTPDFNYFPVNFAATSESSGTPIRSKLVSNLAGDADPLHDASMGTEWEGDMSQAG